MRPDSFDRYSTIHFQLDDSGVLVVRLHSEGSPVTYSHQHYSDWSGAFRDVAMNSANRAVILTGTGEAFCS